MKKVAICKRIWENNSYLLVSFCFQQFGSLGEGFVLEVGQTYL